MRTGFFYPWALGAVMTLLTGPVVGQMALDDATEQFVCRAAIAELMGRDVDIVKSQRRADGIVGTSYVRPSDGTRWRNICRTEGDRVIWATLNGDGTTGRWRTHSDDEILTFALTSAGITITQRFSDGSSLSDEFPMEAK